MSDERDDLDNLLDDAIQDYGLKSAEKKDSKKKDDWEKSYAEGEDDSAISRNRSVEGSRGGGGGLRTPPNSFADASLFQKAMEERIKELNAVSFPQGSSSEGASSSSKKSPASSLPQPPPLPPVPSDEDLDKLMSQMGLDASAAEQMPPVGEGGQQDIMPMMEHMMQALLSKDLLYPAVKDMADKFPEWLADNRQKLTEAEFDRYNKQFDLCQQIVREFDRDLDDDNGEDDKQRQFEKVMNLMQAMQMLGNPPKEICGEAPPGGVLPGLGGQGGGGPNQCKQS